MKGVCYYSVPKRVPKGISRRQEFLNFRDTQSSVGYSIFKYVSARATRTYLEIVLEQNCVRIVLCKWRHAQPEGMASILASSTIATNVRVLAQSKSSCPYELRNHRTFMHSRI